MTQFPAASAAAKGATTEYTRLCRPGLNTTIPTPTLRSAKSRPSATLYSRLSAPAKSATVL